MQFRLQEVMLLIILAATCGDPEISESKGSSVLLFTMDEAPTDGTLEFHILLGNESAVDGEQVFWALDVNKNEQINNMLISNLPGPRYGRVWWQPNGSEEKYLLTSQYWSADAWSTSQEYGIADGNAQPSYHTSFSSAIPESDVCFNLLEGCN